MPDKVPTREILRYVPHLSLAERDRRWKRIRDEMQVRGISCLVIWGNDRCYGTASSNLRYLTHVVPESMSGGIGLLPIEGEPVVWVDYPNYYAPYPAHLGYQEWTSDIRVLAGMKPIAEEIKKRRLDNGKVGLVSHFGAWMVEQPPYMPPYYDVMALQKFLTSVETIEATDLVDKARMIKSTEEITFLQKSGKIGTRMVEALIRAAKPSVRECDVYAEMAATLIREGGEAYMFNQLASGSIDKEWRHLLHGKGLPLGPSTRPLGQNDIIVTEFHANYGGYLTGVEFTALVGSDNRNVREIHEISVEAIKSGMKYMSAGRLLKEAVDAFRKPVQEAGLDYIELGFHGHGLSSPEFPTYVYSSDACYSCHPRGRADD